MFLHHMPAIFHHGLLAAIELLMLITSFLPHLLLLFVSHHGLTTTALAHGATWFLTIAFFPFVLSFPWMLGGYSHIVEAFVSVDDKGQMVLLKDVRTRAEIKSGDELALVSSGKDGKIGCFILVKADLFEHHVRHLSVR